MFTLEFFRLITLRGALATPVEGGVRMKGSIQTQKYGFTGNFAPKNIGILHISSQKYG